MVTLGWPLVHVRTFFPSLFFTYPLDLTPSCIQSKTDPCAPTHPHVSDTWTCCQYIQECFDYTRRRHESSNGVFSVPHTAHTTQQHTHTHTLTNNTQQHSTTQRSTTQHNTEHATRKQRGEKKRRWEMEDGKEKERRKERETRKMKTKMKMKRKIHPNILSIFLDLVCAREQWSCPVFSAASSEVFSATASRTWNSREHTEDTSSWPEEYDKVVLRVVSSLQWPSIRSSHGSKSQLSHGTQTTWNFCSLPNALKPTISLLHLSLSED